MNADQKTREVMERIVHRFETGDIPEPLATLFIVRKLGAAPMTSWSWLNQFICIVFGCTDARGYRQWQEVGRNVIKGQSAAARILVPMTKKKEVENKKGETEEVTRLYGFRGMPVFDVAQTEGDELAETADAEAEREFLANLPLGPVAEHLGVTVTTYSGKPEKARGYYYPNRELIALGVENVDTWLHELIHFADDRMGTLKERGQHWRSETVAQLGAATLATLIGLEGEANLGKTYEYIQAYAEAAGLNVLSACTRVLERTCNAIDYILDTAEMLATAEAVHLPY